MNLPFCALVLAKKAYNFIHYKSTTNLSWNRLIWIDIFTLTFLISNTIDYFFGFICTKTMQWYLSMQFIMVTMSWNIKRHSDINRANAFNVVQAIYGHITCKTVINKDIKIMTFKWRDLYGSTNGRLFLFVPIGWSTGLVWKYAEQILKENLYLSRSPIVFSTKRLNS